MIFNHTAHRELWDWLAKNPKAHLSHWPGWKDNGGDYLAVAMSFACDYKVFAFSAIGKPVRGKPVICENCPLEWPLGQDGCGDGTLFNQWETEKDPAKRAKLAEQIRDLPVREGVECI